MNWKDFRRVWKRGNDLAEVRLFLERGHYVIEARRFVAGCRESIDTGWQNNTPNDALSALADGTHLPWWNWPEGGGILRALYRHASRHKDLPTTRDSLNIGHKG